MGMINGWREGRGGGARELEMDGEGDGRLKRALCRGLREAKRGEGTLEKGISNREGLSAGPS